MVRAYGLWAVLLMLAVWSLAFGVESCRLRNAFKRISYLQKQLEEFENNIRFFERKYNKPFKVFLLDVPDTVEGHDDWIEWTYLIKAADELSKK